MHKMGIVFAALFGAIIVVDGDTVRLDGKSYRLVGCDKPETVWARCRTERERGYSAAFRLKQLIDDSDARLEPTGRYCKWGRGCAHLFLDGEDACHILIREGLALPYSGGKRPGWCD